MIWAFVYTGIIAGIVFLVWYFKFRAPKKKQEESAVLRVYSDTLETTAAGVTVASKNGVSEELKRAIDFGLAEKFADARAAGYSILLEHANYIIYVIPPDREYDSDGNYVPNFLIRADDYDGTQYDKDPRPKIGKIYAAEYVIPESIGAPKGEFVIADYTRAFDTVAVEAVGNGGDHLILFPNDIGKYEATKYHGNGGRHPLIPPRAASRGFFSANRAADKLCRHDLRVRVVGRLENI